MKNIILILLLFFSNNLLSAQHTISITGGWTFSTLYKVGNKEALKADARYGLYNFSLFHAGNISAKYEYSHQSFRLSTGLSLLSLGTNGYFFKDGDLAHMYLTVPVLFGYKTNFSKDLSFVIEGGAEAGPSVMNVGSVVTSSRMNLTRRFYMGILLGLEVKYRRFSLGIRFHLGLNDFEEHTFSRNEETLYLKHIGGTIYLGYTIWDSSKVKNKNKKSLNVN